MIFWLGASICLAITFTVRAEAAPVVPGYDRFHSDTPSAEGGRLLFNELGCVNCHRNPTGLPPKKGPRLSGIGNRVKFDWTKAFLEKPQSRKPGTTMPDMGLSLEEANAIAHYLTSLNDGNAPPKAFKFVNRQRGYELYHKMGCVACHKSEDRASLAEKNNTSEIQSPYPYLKNKYDIHSLSAFLYNPHKYRPHGRMPKFEFEREDGGDIAAYLLDYDNGDSTQYPRIDPISPDPALSEQGKQIVKAHNCVACHELPSSERISRPSRSKASPPYQLPPRHPQYALTENHWESISLFLNQRTKPSESASLSLQALNCLACHERNGQGGPNQDVSHYFTGDSSLGDTGRFPPPLTDSGRKLQSKWLEAAIAGNRPVRPYLNTQMPDFGPAVKGLANQLFKEDKPAKQQRVRKSLAEAGRTLLGAEGGFNCITCHSWGERQSLGIEALNLGNLHERLQLEWLEEYLADPNAYRPNTLMPSFWPNGISSNQEILDGDTKMQIEAIYSFSKYGEGLPDGFPKLNTSEFEIVPTDRPIVQRTFLDGVGTHALVVGFPAGIHYAIDGKTGQPAIMWKGRFFDAYRTWFSRFPEFEKPLGHEVVFWNQDPETSDAFYRGYRLDASGVPEFVSELYGAELSERLEPIDSEPNTASFRRSIRYGSETQLDDPRLLHPKGVAVREIETDNPLTREFIYQW